MIYLGSKLKKKKESGKTQEDLVAEFSTIGTPTVLDFVNFCNALERIGFVEGYNKAVSELEKLAQECLELLTEVTPEVVPEEEGSKDFEIGDLVRAEEGTMFTEYKGKVGTVISPPPGGSGATWVEFSDGQRKGFYKHNLSKVKRIE